VNQCQINVKCQILILSFEIWISFDIWILIFELPPWGLPYLQRADRDQPKDNANDPEPDNDLRFSPAL